MIEIAGKSNHLEGYIMEKSIFERVGGKYVRQGDHLLTDQKLPEIGDYEIDVWGQRYRRLLKA